MCVYDWEGRRGGKWEREGGEEGRERGKGR